jgi:hypothetical protein
MRRHVLSTIAAVMALGREHGIVQDLPDPIQPPLLGPWGCNYGDDTGPGDGAPRYNQRKARKHARRLGRKAARRLGFVVR